VVIVARGIDRYGIKKIIDELEKKPLSWADLKASTKLSDSTLSRYLSYLELWGLAKKNEEGHWDWYERVRTYETEHDYEVALEHSKKLLSTLDGDFGIITINPDWVHQRNTLSSNMRDKLCLSEMVREHLRTGYPLLFSEVVNLDKLVELRSSIAVELSTPESKIEKGNVIEYVANFRRFKAYIIPKKYRKEVEKIVANILPKRLDLIEQTEKRYGESLIKVFNELHRLEFKVDHGEPLMGICDLCPKSKVLS
jgi:hypothetical protein